MNKNCISLVTVLIFGLLLVHGIEGNEIKEREHGFLDYKLIELEKKRILKDEGKVINEIALEKRKSFILMGHKLFEDRYLKVFGDFIIGLNYYGYKNNSSSCGFGIWLKKTDESTFSWEWYKQVSETDFKKLQGEGRLKIQWKKRGDWWVIKKISFIGNHILRCKRTFSRTENWHCVVKEGSYIIW